MKGTLRILDKSGDTLVEWDTDKPEGRLDPEYARQEFKRLVDEGHLLFVDTSNGVRHKGLMLRDGEFDPERHERVIAAPQFVGG